MPSLPPDSFLIVGIDAGVGACVVGAGVGACVVGAGVGACLVGAGVGACEVGAGVGDALVTALLVTPLAVVRFLTNINLGWFFHAKLTGSEG